MRVAKVLTHLRCNQACSYCGIRRAADEPRFIRADAVRERIDAALAEGAREVVLSGGEPTMRGDLEALVAHARAGGVDVTLETNATLIDPARAATLVAAGLGRARVNLAGWGEGLDEITRDPGGFAATCRGLSALLGAGLTVDVSTAIVRSTRSLLAALPAGLAGLSTAGRAVQTLWVVVPVTSPDPDELLPWDEAARAILELDAAADDHAIGLKLVPEHAPPPCIFPPRARIAHLYSLGPGAASRPGHLRLDACKSCRVVDRCPGFSAEYLARFPPPVATPVAEERMRRRLSLIGTPAEQIARELVTPNRVFIANPAGDEGPGGVNGAVQEEAIVRVNFHCNQRCDFCFVSTHLPPAGDAAVRAAIIQAGEQGRRITLSGGEPTLNSRLPEYVRLARDVSKYPVELQTNAIRLDDEELVKRLVAAGLSEASVSLHGSCAEISDAITVAPGTFVRTVVGIDNLVRHGVATRLMFVICEKNRDDLVPFVRLVASRWPRVSVGLSFVAPSTDLVPRDAQMIPRYTGVLPGLSLALREARELGVSTHGLDSMCGIPLCLIPEGSKELQALPENPDGFDQGAFTYAPECDGCTLMGRCWGIRRTYAELHGTDELRARRAPATPSAAPSAALSTC